MAIDPICGMTVDEASGLRAERDGQTFFFCSSHCRQRFLSTSANVDREATVTAGMRRVRPCLMTNATTLLALISVLTITRGARRTLRI